MIATVRYQIGQYSGAVDVTCDPDDDDENVIARAKSALRRRCGGVSIYPGGPCYESWSVVSRGEGDGT